MGSLAKVRTRLRDIFGEDCEKITKAQLREANELRHDAEKAVALTLPYARLLANELDLSSIIEVGPTKTLPRIFEKAVSKHGGVEYIDEIGDIGRLRVPISSAEDVMNLRYMFGGGKGASFAVMHPTNNIKVTGAQDYFWEPSPTGRIAFHLDLDVALSGSKTAGVEIQFVHKNMIDTDRATHSNYRKACRIERIARKDGRALNAEEAEAIKNYREDNQQMYLSDALNYGLYDLRRPDLQHYYDEVPKPVKWKLEMAS